MSAYDERATTFRCVGETLIGIVASPRLVSRRGVVIVVGGPQYRVGSHRQFVLLARYMASIGLPTFRFDCRGMGDSSGELRDFEGIGPDIGAAIDHFFSAFPMLKEVVVWGLCDAASAALFHAHKDPRIVGLILLNPWVRTREGEAKAYVRHYYMKQFLLPQFWSKLLRGGVHIGDSLRGLIGSLRLACAGKDRSPDHVGLTLPERMAHGMQRFTGATLFILSGNDITAGEFKDLVASSPEWRRLMARPDVARIDIPDANHTFARDEWRTAVACYSADWINGL